MLISIILGILLIGVIVYSSFYNRNLLQPSLLFTLVILTTFFIASLRLSLLQSNYPIWFAILILLLILIFSAGCRTADNIKLPSPKTQNVYSTLTMKVLVFLIWIAIISSFMMMVYLLGAPPAISKLNRADYFVSGWGTIVVLQSMFFAILLYDRYNKNAIKSMFWFYSLSIIVISLLLSNKFQIFYMLITYIIASNTYRKKIKLKTFLLLSAIIIAVFIFLFEFVYEDMYGVSLEVMQLGYGMVLPRKLYFLIQPYMYIAFNYENLYHYLSVDHYYLYGLKTFGAMLDILHVNVFFESPLSLYLDEWQQLLRVKSLTTGTVFQDFAQDGGIPIMLLFTYFCGIISEFSYRLFSSNKTFGNFYLYVSTTVAIFMSFFSNTFTSKVVLINLLIAFITSYILNRVFLIKKG